MIPNLPNVLKAMSYSSVHNEIVVSHPIQNYGVKSDLRWTKIDACLLLKLKLINGRPLINN